ncbi:MAG TPA: GNAT family N-acetyltransferase [Flavobacterium sp.]|nr:GNAT family N-acetyltransferase [Flavobacterium sp.]
MAEIRRIGALETFAVRHPVLRGGKPLESCRFDGDDLETTRHFGYYENGNLIGVISLFGARNKSFAAEKQFQVRGMAILENHQKKGIGEKLMRHTENYVLENYGHFIWFNAREIAVGFYGKLGYEIYGDSFDIPDVGPHYVMFKTLAEVR